MSSLNWYRIAAVWCGRWRYLEADEALLPGANSRQVDLSEGLVGEPHVHALPGDSELEGNRLVGFGHDD